LACEAMFATIYYLAMPNKDTDEGYI
jgi:hypothetical protein